MGQKIATMFYVMIQLLFFAAGLTVLKKYQADDLQASLTVDRAATIVVVFYTLGSASRKIFDVWVSFCRGPHDGKGMDL